MTPEGGGHLLKNPREGEGPVEHPRLTGVHHGITIAVIQPVSDGDLVEVSAQRLDAGGVSSHQRTDAPEEVGAARLKAVGGQGGDDGGDGHGEYLLHLMA